MRLAEITEQRHAELLPCKVNWNTAPRGMFGDTDKRPSWASMIARQIDSPIPMPSDLVVKSGLKIRSRCCGLIPVPMSATDIVTPSPPHATDLTHRTRGSSSDAIESMAFVIRLINTCCSCTRFPRTSGSCASRLRFDPYSVFLQIAAFQGKRFVG